MRVGEEHCLTSKAIYLIFDHREKFLRHCLLPSLGADLLHDLRFLSARLCRWFTRNRGGLPPRRFRSVVALR